MRTTVLGLLLGCGVAATTIATAGACQYRQTSTPAQVALTDPSPSPAAPAPIIIPPDTPVQPTGQTHSE
jgi:hypothetical protein